MLRVLLDLLIFSGRTEKKLAKLAFLDCWKFVEKITMITKYALLWNVSL